MVIANNNNFINNKLNSHNRQNTWLLGKEKKTKQNKTKKNKTKQQNNNNTYSLHPNYEKTTLSNMQRKHHVH